MKKMDRKIIEMLALLGVLIMVVVFISGCIQKPEEVPAEGRPSITTPTEKATTTLPKGTSAGKIAFTSGGSVYVINDDGTDKLKLAEGGNPQWSPDGKRIVYAVMELEHALPSGVSFPPEAYAYLPKVAHYYVINY